MSETAVEFIELVEDDVVVTDSEQEDSRLSALIGTFPARIADLERDGERVLARLGLS
jgi:hypothetical protein